MKSHFSKKGTILILATLLIGLIAVVVSTGPFSGLSDSEFDESIGCNRATLEIRKTDKYCGDQELYNKECAGVFKKKSPDCEPY